MPSPLHVPETFTFLGYDVERGAAARGALVAAAIVLVSGVGVGSFVSTDSDASILITALIAIGFIAGGVAAGVYSSVNHIVHGTISAVPVALIAVVVQLIRRVADNSQVGWLNLVFVAFFATSLGTLGGVIGGRFSPARRSLLR